MHWWLSGNTLIYNAENCGLNSSLQVLAVIGSLFESVDWTEHGNFSGNSIKLPEQDLYVKCDIYYLFSISGPLHNVYGNPVRLANYG
jgi:hypothetical protein